MKETVKKLVLEFGSPDEIQEMAEKKENLYSQIRDLLKEKPRTAYEVAEELNILAGSARYYLQNMTRSGKVLTQIIKVKNQKQVIYQLKKKESEETMAKPEVIEKIKCAISHINKEGGAANFRAIAELINENTKLTNGTLVYLKTSGVV